MTGSVRMYDENLLSVNLNNNLLSGVIISDTLYILPALKYLYLNSNNITGKLELENWKNLVELDVGHNQFSGSLPHFIPDSLRKINLESNQFIGTIPFQWKDLKLTDINLKGNNICGCIPNEWSKLLLNTCSLFDALDCKCTVPNTCPHSCDKTVRSSLCGTNLCLSNNTLCSSQRPCQAKLKNDYYSGYECANCTGYYSNDGDFNCVVSSTLLVIVLATLIPGVILISLIIIYLVWKCKVNNAMIDFDNSELNNYFNGNLEDRGFERIPDSDTHFKQIHPDDPEYNIFTKLKDALDFGKMDIFEVYSLVSLTQANGLLTEKKVLETRHQLSPETFKSSSWKSENNDLKEWTKNHFEHLLSSNCFQYPGMVPTVHGTSEKVAWKIATTGFAPLQSLDAGFYGKGIYLSTSARYITPYFSKHNKPAILICLSLPGNAYPVTEDPVDKDNSFCGKSILQGYQSHYVRTEASGFPCKKRNDNAYDELVVASHTQVIPVFLVRIQKDCLPELIKEFQREIVEND